MLTSERGHMMKMIMDDVRRRKEEFNTFINIKQGNRKIFVYNKVLIP
jgi:hypothetical protein